MRACDLVTCHVTLCDHLFLCAESFLQSQLLRPRNTRRCTNKSWLQPERKVAQTSPSFPASSFGLFTLSNKSDRKGLAEVAQLLGKTLHDMTVHCTQVYAHFSPTVVCIPYILEYKPGLLFPSQTLETRCQNETGVKMRPAFNRDQHL